MPFVPREQFDTEHVAPNRLYGFRLIGEVETLHDLAKEIAALQLGPKCRVEVVYIQVKQQTTLVVSVEGAYPRTARALVDQRIEEGYHLRIADDWFESVAYSYEKEFVPFGGDEITDEHPF